MTKKPSYRFVGYTEPWEQRKLGECTEISAGGDIEKSKLLNNGKYPVIANALTSDGIVGYYNDIYRIEAPAVTVTGRGDVGVAKARNVNFTPVVRLLSLKSEHDVIFLENAINTQKIVIESTGVPQLTAPQLGRYNIFFPSLPEQTAIGSFFQDIDQLISLQQRKLEVLKEQKKTYLKLLFPAKGQTKPALRFAGFEDEWKEVKLGEVFDIVTDYVANGSFESLRNNVRTYEKDNFAYMIRLQDASNSWKGPWLYTDEKGYNFLSKSRLFKDDILMSNVGTVGRFFQVPELDRPMTLAPNSVLIRSTSSNNQFLYFMMLTANIQDQITMRKTPGVQDKINKTDFKKVIATLPALSEQEAIGSFFQDLDKAIAKQEEKVNQLKESKQTLLRKMFT